MLLSLLLWGTVWGITGMVLAVPITAVLRIRLLHIAHPLPQYIASLLVGETTTAPTGGASDGDEEASGGGDAPARAGGVGRNARDEGRTRLLAAPGAPVEMSPPLEPAQDKPAAQPTEGVELPPHHHAL